ncbi:hypothetical protein GCK32_006927 [Trichostrongylus colubriformis]|uniref:Uncharacterized protein n=1 Tax=Trichostrongylus colubriformis TaxID=6319 RepID=A0AAN8EVR0_TRICO
MWLAGLLLFLFPSQALAKFSKADMFVFDTGYEEIFLPAIDISENGTVRPAAVHRVYKFRDCKFRLSFNAVLCPESGHKVIVSFMNHWLDPMKITKKMMERNSFIFQAQSSQDTKVHKPKALKPGRMRMYTAGYHVFVIREGRTIQTERVKFKLDDGHNYITIEGGNASLRRLSIVEKDIEENMGADLDLQPIRPRYIALFATHLQHCPAFISAIDREFDVWTRQRGVTVQGRSDEYIPPRRYINTCLRDVTLSIVAIVFYYYCLTIVILPAYFNITMPLNHRRSERALTAVLEDEESLNDDNKTSERAKGSLPTGPESTDKSK